MNLPTTITTASTVTIISSTTTSSSSLGRCWAAVTSHLNSANAKQTFKIHQQIEIPRIFLTSIHDRLRLCRPFPGVRLQHHVCHRTERKQSLGSLVCAGRAECRYLQPLHIAQKLFSSLQVSFDKWDYQPARRNKTFVNSTSEIFHRRKKIEASNSKMKTTKKCAFTLRLIIPEIDGGARGACDMFVLGNPIDWKLLTSSTSDLF